LVKKRFESLVVGESGGKVCNANKEKIMLEIDCISVSIVLEDVGQSIPGLHGSGVRFNDGSQKVAGDNGINPL
jgi:hypothetical protein